MHYTEVPYTRYLPETLALLEDPGLLLVTQGRDGRPNAMTIGWGTVGVIWGKPIFCVLVRPSRYSYRLLEEGQAFTVCVPSEAQYDAVDFCGTRSGRECDKFRECGLQVLPSLRVAVPGIAGCPVIYECRVVHRSDVVPEHLVQEVRDSAYPKGDFHRVYFGEILVVRALPNAGDLLHP
jgi:flavin reductase (DIM6/NTAB) family NADH-FMN oxidoreductase RutF